MGSVSAGRFGVLFLGLVVGILLGRLWSDEAREVPPRVLHAAARAGMPQSLDQIEQLLDLRRDYLSAHAVRVQRELREAAGEHPALVHYLGLQEISASVLLGTLGQVEPRAGFCEHGAAVTEVGKLAQAWVCGEDRICAPDLVDAFRALVACDPASRPEACREVFEASAGRPPLRCEATDG